MSSDKPQADGLVEDEEISELEHQAFARSKAWFKQNEGTPFEQVVAELGFAMDQIQAAAKDPAA